MSKKILAVTPELIGKRVKVVRTASNPSLGFAILGGSIGTVEAILPVLVQKTVPDMNNIGKTTVQQFMEPAPFINFYGTQLGHVQAMNIDNLEILEDGE